MQRYFFLGYPLTMNKLKQLPNSLLIVLIVAAAVAIATVIMLTAPTPERKAKAAVSRLVEVMDIEKSQQRPSWIAGGEVSASQRVSLTSQVTGNLINLNPLAIPGAVLAAGTTLAQIDPQDFKLQVIQKEATVVQTQADLAIEQGQGRLAKQEYELSQGQTNNRRMSGKKLSQDDKNLILRKPQILAKQAAVKKAQADLGLAQLQLQRSKISMPFNGQIISRSISTGSQVANNTELFDIVSSDTFWLQVKVAKHFYPWLDQQAGVAVSHPSWPLENGERVWRNATILHHLAEVDVSDRQAKILIEIENPLSMQPGVLLGDYLDVRLQGKEIAESYVIASKHLVDEQYVWVVNDNALFKRKLNIVYQGRERVWVKSGFNAGDKLLLSNLGIITEGTPVRLLSSSLVDTKTNSDQVK